MNKRQGAALGVAALVIAVGWFASAVVGGALSYFSVVPAPFVQLVLPETIPHYSPAASVIMNVAGLVSAVVCGILFVVFWMLFARADRTAIRFGGGWLAAILSSFATTLLWTVGLVIGDWPPLRLAFVFSNVSETVLNAGYVGLVWGWLPALIVALMTRRTVPMGVPDAATNVPRRTAPKWVIAASAAVAAVLLVGVVPLTVAAPRMEVQPAPEPPPTSSPVVYGSPLVGTPLQDSDPTWCSDTQAEATLGGGDAATGHRMQRLLITNTSGEECVLNGYPDLAFDDVDGWAMDVLVVTGGSFMTTDAGAQPITLEPGATAHADLGWNAQAAAGDTQAGTILVAPYVGVERTPLPFQLDIVAGGNVAVTAWELEGED